MRNSLGEPVIVITGTVRKMAFYLPGTNTWYELPKSPSKPDKYDVLVSRGDKIYKLNSDFSVFERYDPLVNRWTSSTMPRIPCKLEKCVVDAVAVNNGDIFATLYDAAYFVVAVWKYNFNSGLWRSITLPLRWPYVAFEDKFVYAMGGTLPSEDHSKQCTRLDTVENKMKELAPMQIARFGGYGVAAHRKIFVLAGCLSKEETAPSDCEMYNIDSNEWHFIATVGSLTIEYSLSCMQCDGTKLYLVERSKNANLVCYNIERNEWTKIPIPWVYCHDYSVSNYFQPNITIIPVMMSACSFRIPKKTLGRFHRAKIY